MSWYERWLVLLTRLVAVVLMAAFPAMFLPYDWMNAGHQFLGMGELPANPLTGYLTRSIAALYGFHGVLYLYLSFDVRRHLSVLRFVACMSLLFGIAMLAIDLYEGMPWFWTATEGPSIIVTYGLLVWLCGKVAAERSP